MPVLEYFNLKRGSKAKQEAPVQSPVLNDDEESFLKRVVSEENAPPLPQRPVVILDGGNAPKGKDAQTALMDGANTIPLPQSPPLEARAKEDNKEPKGESSKSEGKKKDDKKKKVQEFLNSNWSYISSINLRGKDKSKEETGDALASVAQAIKEGDSHVQPDGTITDKDAAKEKEDLTQILDQLNLAAVNNRVFSFSKESQELLEQFKLVFIDLVNGVPTAYDDLETLLKNSNEQLSKMFDQMPDFLQNLVKSLPTKMSAALAPEILAAASEKPGADGAKLLATEAAGPSTTARVRQIKKHAMKVPSLKKLVSQQGSVAAMLRSILNFLKLRFPAFVTGTNVLMSLALFLLLFVFWYCHKRGREVRLEKERLAREAGVTGGGYVSDGSVTASDLEESTVLDADSKKKEKVSDKADDTAKANEEPSAQAQNLPSVLDLPEPGSVPLPKSPQPPTPVGEKQKEAELKK